MIAYNSSMLRRIVALPHLVWQSEALQIPTGVKAKYARDRSLNGEFDSSTTPLLNWAAMRAPVLVRACMLLMLAALLLTGCASVPKDYPRTPSTAFPDYASTAIGAYFEKAAASHPGQSGFGILPDGSRAFTARIAMTELAEKTLDLQYLRLGSGRHRPDPGRAPGPGRRSRRTGTHPGG